MGSLGAGRIRWFSPSDSHSEENNGEEEEEEDDDDGEDET